MIKIENTITPSKEQWGAIIMGMRNPMNSWDKCDSSYWSGGFESNIVEIGPNDQELMMKLANGGPVHAKYRRMITVYVDITAPLYWWKEFDTYKVGTVANSCSTMHKIHDKKFEYSDFSGEHLSCDDSMMCSFKNDEGGYDAWYPEMVMELVVKQLNACRLKFIETGDKKYWWQMIQLLPSSYNQKRTVMLNYEVLVGIYKWRKEHKLDEWREFCKWIEQLPYSEIITGKVEENAD